MNTQINYVSAPFETTSTEQQIKIKYIYLLIKTLVANGVLKKNRFNRHQFEAELTFKFQEIWRLNIQFDKAQASASVRILNEAWKINESVYFFSPEEEELRYISERTFAEVRENNLNQAIDWINLLEKAANNALETNGMRIKY
jgi:hypothetical protein